MMTLLLILILISSPNFSGSDTELVVASQEIEQNLSKIGSPCPPCLPPKTDRFSEPVTVRQIETLCNAAHSDNTEAKSRWAWVEERLRKNVHDGVMLDRDILKLAHDEDKLNEILMRFLMEVRNKKGEEYRGNTLYEILTALQYYIRRKGTDINVFESPFFKGLRNVLNGRMKSLAKQGIGIDKQQASVISRDQEDILWQQRLLCEDRPEQFLDTLVYLIGLHFALRAGDEHRNLRVDPNSQVTFVSDSNGARFLKYTEDISKTNRGGLNSRKIEKKSIRISENKEQPERCLVRLYEKYMSLRPRSGKCQAFHLRPLQYAKDDVWYADSAVGKHPLRSTVSKLCKKAGFPGFYSNHSLRATAATRLYDSGIDEQLIAERTGHRSLALRSYKRTSSEMEDRVSDVIRGKIPCTVTRPASAACTSTNTTDVVPPMTSTSSTSTTKRNIQLDLADGTVVALSF